MARPVPTCTCGSCSTCRHREAQRRYRERNPEKVRERKRKWGKTRNREGDPQAAETWKAYYERTREERLAYAKKVDKRKRRARNILNAAIRRGTIERGPCEVCGKEKVDAHHDDYDKPLEVRWLCRRHHMRLHRSS